MSDYIERLWTRLQNVISSGRLTAVDDAGPVQRIQVNFGPQQIVDGIIVPHDFGFSSNPPIDSDVAAGFMSGDRSKGIAYGINSQKFRYKNLPSGGTVLYDANGNSVLLTADGITVTSNALPVLVTGATTVTVVGTGSVTLRAPTITLDGNAVVTGNLGVAGDITDVDGSNTATLQSLRAAYNEHAHLVPGIQTGASTIGTNITDSPDV